MKTKIILILFAFLSAAAFGCTEAGKSTMIEKDMTKKDDPIIEKETMMNKEEQMTDKMPDEDVMQSGYNGKALAGTESKYIEFNKADYDKALKQNKKILLYFYANWCPICKREQVDTYAAFNELKDPSLVGFRVNYRDGDDDEHEKALAKEFGIGYQHTKVILKDGQRVLKAPDSWDKIRYLEELGKI